MKEYCSKIAGKKFIKCKIRNNGKYYKFFCKETNCPFQIGTAKIPKIQNLLPNKFYHYLKNVFHHYEKQKLLFNVLMDM